jgi:DNA-binding NarL/FixJ family response regulator
VPLTIVVADDDPDFRALVRHLLTSARESMVLVGEAADGAHALSLVLRERPDVLLTDLLMPGFDGVELTRRLREAMPDLKIILMSSHTEDAYRLMASDSGADAFVNKQVIVSSLVPAIRDVVGRRLSGGSWPLPPGAGASSWPAAPLN